MPHPFPNRRSSDLAIASDLKIIEAYQAERYRPTLPISPIDLMLLIDDRARSGAAKSSLDRLVASAVRLHKLLELPSPVAENLRWKQKEIRKKIGRGSCRERVCTYVSLSVVDVTIKKKQVQ